jgi:16S rRNA (cytosine967-C5)-methyltransferase
MLVIDACAGGGGKSLHLAALMQNEGRIIAQDVRPAALENLRARADRAGATIIRTETIAGPESIARRAGTADRLLLDVPCSGLGVLRRQPDTKWKLTPAELDRLTALQRDLLRTVPAMLKPGGLMVYATCSILPRENEHQIRALMADQPGLWTIEDERRLPPGAEGDGFYAVRLRRGGLA